jgi:hypothetical protein
VVTARSESIRRSFGRDPFIPEPTSDSTLATRPPALAAHSESLATCRSKSWRWSWEETLAYSPRACGEELWGDAGEMRIVRCFTRMAGTGRVPLRNHL